VALSPQANYTDCATATYRRNLVPTFVDRGLSRGQCGGSRTVVNLSFLDGISLGNYWLKSHQATNKQVTIEKKIVRDDFPAPVLYQRKTEHRFRNMDFVSSQEVIAFRTVILWFYRPKWQIGWTGNILMYYAPASVGLTAVCSVTNIIFWNSLHHLFQWVINH
jgi:hypothetical protein